MPCWIGHMREHGSPEQVLAYLIDSEEFKNLQAPARTLSPQLAFEAVYGYAPNDAEMTRMNEYVGALQELDRQMKVVARNPAAPDNSHLAAITAYRNEAALDREGLSGQEMLRAAVTAFPRNTHPTPISARFSDKNLVKANIKNAKGKLVLDRLDWSVSSTIIVVGDYEAHLSRFIRYVVKPGMTCIDIGANVGFHVLTLSELVGSAGRVYAVEPNSENCRMLMMSAEANGATNITVVPVALSNKLGAAAFSPALGSNGQFMHAVSSPLHHPNCTVVPTVRLDTIIAPDRLDFIKIDIEGAEPLALAGAEALIEKHRPIITSEFSVTMVSDVSGISGEEYIGRMIARDYRAYTLAASGPHQEITDPQSFLANWPDKFRIEDLAFVPRENSFDFEAFKAGAT